ncbi:PaaI family thioesterase [Candidatus Sumerlaeota bacterium]|nr:PaaI family thioesterase [Candidatus Sumerlaeota bacterium]
MSERTMTAETAPYIEALGAMVESLSESAVKVVLPYKDENSNPGKVLHGGVAASLINIAGMAVGRAALEGKKETDGQDAHATSGPWHTAGINVQYLSAAIGETIVAEGSLLRKGKDLAFVEVLVKTEAGKLIAHGSSIIRGRFGAEEPPALTSGGDDGAADPGVMGPNLPLRVPFIGRLGLKVENMSGGRARIVMPFTERNANETGGVHEGAILAHLDTTGAMAAWAENGAGRFKASTVGINASLTAPTRPGEDLIAYGRMAQRDKEIFWCEIEIAAAGDKRVVARGTEIYRIVK